MKKLVNHYCYCKDCHPGGASKHIAPSHSGMSSSGRRWHLRTKYGITYEQYQAIMDAQGNRCAACGDDIAGRAQRGTRRINRAVVDHSHKTGVVRGMLCDSCNKAVGYLKDSPDRAMRIAAYLGGLNG